VKRNPATIDGEPLYGYLNVLKPPAMTSFDVVARVRSLTGQRRVGHAGTLDPAAVGVLPVALGRATPTLSSPLWDRKLYWADIGFGTATDTDDGEGQPIAVGSPDAITADRIMAALPQFLGDIEQRPPAFSAIHVEGRRSYVSARRGEVAELPARLAHVDGITLTCWDSPVASLRVQCGSGTYIRAIARDLGAALGCPAHMAHLVRLRVGPFSIEESLDLRALEAIADAGAWERVLYPADIVATERSAIVAPMARAQDYAQGREWSSDTPADQSETTVRLYTADGRFRGVARRTDRRRWQPLRGLPPAEPVS
jgi:tRNA pseudouridine55 synthase